MYIKVEELEREEGDEQPNSTEDGRSLQSDSDGEDDLYQMRRLVNARQLMPDNYYVDDGIPATIYEVNSQAERTESASQAQRTNSGRRFSISSGFMFQLGVRENGEHRQTIQTKPRKFGLDRQRTREVEDETPLTEEPEEQFYDQKGRSRIQTVYASPKKAFLHRLDDYETIIENESEAYKFSVDQGGQSTVKDQSNHLTTKSLDRRSQGLNEESQEQNGAEFDYLADGDDMFIQQMTAMQRESISSKRTGNRSGTLIHRCSFQEKRLQKIEEEGNHMTSPNQALTDSINNEELKEGLESESFPQYNSAAVSSQNTTMKTVVDSRDERGQLSMDPVALPRRTMRTLKPKFPPLQVQSVAKDSVEPLQSERKVLSRWPRNLIKRVKKLKQENQMEQIGDIRTSLILSGMTTQIPPNLSIKTVDVDENPILFRHVLRHSTLSSAKQAPAAQLSLKKNLSHVNKSRAEVRQSVVTLVDFHQAQNRVGTMDSGKHGSTQPSRHKRRRTFAGSSQNSQSFQSSSFSSQSYFSAKKKTAKRRSTAVYTKSLTSDLHGKQSRINQYVLQKSLGKGSHGSVYLCLNMLDSQIMIMKVINRCKCRAADPGSSAREATTNKNSNQMSSSPAAQITSIATEMESLKEMVHVNVLSPIEIIDDVSNENIFLISTYMRLGSLEDRLEESIKQRMPNLEQEEVRQNFRGLVSALHYFHEVKNVAHGGIKASNLMIDESTGSVLVCDYGLSTLFKGRAGAEYAAINKARGHQHDSMHGAAASKPFRHQDVRYVPPELLEDQLQGLEHTKPIEVLKKADIWAAGVTLYRLLTREFPTKANTIVNMQLQLRSKDPINLDLIENVEVRQLLSQMLEKDPGKRCSVIEAAQSPWLTRNNGDPIDLDLSSLSSNAAPDSFEDDDSSEDSEDP